MPITKYIPIQFLRKLIITITKDLFLSSFFEKSFKKRIEILLK